MTPQELFHSALGQRGVNLCGRPFEEPVQAGGRNWQQQRAHQDYEPAVHGRVTVFKES